MANVNADTIANSAGTGAPSFSFGMSVPTGQVGTFTSGVKVKDAGAGSTTLSHYEEGTFTPTVTPSSGSFSPSPTYGTQVGKFTRIGRAVFYSISMSVTNAPTGAGTVKISGLPYTCSATGRYGATMYAENVDFTGSWPMAEVINSDTSMDTFGLADDAGSTGMPSATALDSGSTKIIRVNGWYEV